MNSSDRLRWLPAVLCSGAVYVAAGITFAALASRATSNHMRVTCRLAAWVISAAVFAAQIGYEHARLRSTPGITALHASLAVALGAFALAVAATVHAASSQRHFPVFALVLWPLVTALPAYLVAFASAAALARARRSAVE